jgi:hypothetical protein
MLLFVAARGSSASGRGRVVVSYAAPAVYPFHHCMNVASIGTKQTTTQGGYRCYTDVRLQRSLSPPHLW